MREEDLRPLQGAAAATASRKRFFLGVHMHRENQSFWTGISGLHMLKPQYPGLLSMLGWPVLAGMQVSHMHIRCLIVQFIS